MNYFGIFGIQGYKKIIIEFQKNTWNAFQYVGDSKLNQAQFNNKTCINMQVRASPSRLSLSSILNQVYNSGKIHPNK